MTEGVDDGLAEGGVGEFGDIDSAEAFEAHADVDVPEDVFLGLVDEGRKVGDEVVLVDEGGIGRGGKDGTAELQDRLLGEEEGGRVAIPLGSSEAEILQDGRGVRPFEACEPNKGAQTLDADLESGDGDGFAVPSFAGSVFPKDDGFEFLGGELPVLVGDAHVGAAMGVVGGLGPGEGDTDAMPALDGDGGDLGIDLGLDVGGDGLGDLAQGGFRDVHANGMAVVADAQPQFAPAVLVEDGRDGNQTLAEFGKTLLVLDGFGFAHRGDRAFRG